LTSKLHNWCIQAILLLLEICYIGIEVVFEWGKGGWTPPVIERWLHPCGLDFSYS